MDNSDVAIPQQILKSIRSRQAASRKAATAKSELLEALVETTEERECREAALVEMAKAQGLLQVYQTLADLRVARKKRLMNVLEKNRTQLDDWSVE